MILVCNCELYVSTCKPCVVTIESTLHCLVATTFPTVADTVQVSIALIISHKPKNTFIKDNSRHLTMYSLTGCSTNTSMG